jgi:2,4-diketo-3-deoxy-L-fuconate hydrolase
MKIVGIHDGGTVFIARRDNTTVIPLAPVDTFYADPDHWLQARSEHAPIPATQVHLAPPVPTSARVWCLGLNYRAHAAEGPFSVPEHPTLFGRWTASLSVDGAPVAVPRDEPGLDWEGEVAAILRRPLRDATPEQALDAVLGYAAFNDLTARQAQRLSHQWTLGKNADASGPLGPLVTADEVGDLRRGLRLVTRVNGEIVQDANTKDMIFSVGEVLSLISRTLTLHPGDVLATGTPEGVGYARTPPRLLTPGDIVEVDIERLGSVTTPVVYRDGSAAST